LAFAEHGAGASVDSAWEQEKLKARKMLAVRAARREAAVPSVQCTLCWAAVGAFVGLFFAFLSDLNLAPLLAPLARKNEPVPTSH